MIQFRDLGFAFRFSAPFLLRLFVPRFSHLRRFLGSRSRAREREHLFRNGKISASFQIQMHEHSIDPAAVTSDHIRRYIGVHSCTLKCYWPRISRQICQVKGIVVSREGGDFFTERHMYNNHVCKSHVVSLEKRSCVKSM